MDTRIDRCRVAGSFDRQAEQYDQHAEVQKRVVRRVVDLAKNHLLREPGTILDVGCGTGQLLAALKGGFPQADLCGLDLAPSMLTCAARRLGNDARLVVGDAEHLPFSDASVDLLVSTSTLQWLDGLDVFFHEAERVVASDGLLCVAFFGGRTLYELHDCLRSATEPRSCCRTGGDEYASSLHRFMSRGELEDAVARSGFKRALILSEIEMEQYGDVFELLRSIKRIGAGTTARSGKHVGLGWKRVIEETSQRYSQRYGVGGKIPATYEVFYVVAEGIKRS